MMDVRAKFHKLGILPISHSLGYFEQDPTRDYATLRSLGQKFLATYETEDRTIPPTFRSGISEFGSEARTCSREFLHIYGPQLFQENGDNTDKHPIWPQDEEFIEVAAAHFLQQLAFRNYQKRCKKAAKRKRCSEEDDFHDDQSTHETEADHDDIDEPAIQSSKQPDTNACIRYIQELNPANEEKLEDCKDFSWLWDRKLSIPETVGKRLRRFMHEHNVYLSLDSGCETLRLLVAKMFEEDELTSADNILDHPQLLHQINDYIQKHTVYLQEHFYLDEGSSVLQKTERFDDLWTCREEYWNAKRQRKGRCHTLPVDIEIPQKRRSISKVGISTGQTDHFKEPRHSLTPESARVETSVASPQEKMALHNDTTTEAVTKYHGFPDALGVTISDTKKSKPASLLLKLKLPNHHFGTPQTLGPSNAASTTFPTMNTSTTENADNENQVPRSAKPKKVAQNIHHASTQGFPLLEFSDGAISRMKAVWYTFRGKSQRSHWYMRTVGSKTEPRCIDERHYHVKLEGSRWYYFGPQSTKEILVEDVYCERIILEWKANPTLDHQAFVEWFFERFTGATLVQLTRLIREIGVGAVRSTRRVPAPQEPGSIPTTTDIVDVQQPGPHADTSATNLQATQPLLTSLGIDSLPRDSPKIDKMVKSSLSKSSVGYPQDTYVSPCQDIPVLDNLGTIDDPVSLSSGDDLSMQGEDMDDQFNANSSNPVWSTAGPNNESMSECTAFEEAYFGSVNNGEPNEVFTDPRQFAHPHSTASSHNIHQTMPQEKSGSTNPQPIAFVPSNNYGDSITTESYANNFVATSEFGSPGLEFASILSSSACKRCASLKVKCVNEGVLSTCNACAKSQRACVYSEITKSSPEPQASIKKGPQQPAPLPTPETINGPKFASAFRSANENITETSPTNIKDTDESSISTSVSAHSRYTSKTFGPSFEDKRSRNATHNIKLALDQYQQTTGSHERLTLSSSAVVDNPSTMDRTSLIPHSNDREGIPITATTRILLEPSSVAIQPIVERDTTYQKPKHDLVDSRHCFNRSIPASNSSTEIVIASAKKVQRLLFFIEKENGLLDRDFPIPSEHFFGLSVYSVFELIAKRTGQSLAVVQFECENFGVKDHTFELQRYNTSEVDWKDHKIVMERFLRRGKKKYPECMDFVIRILTSLQVDDDDDEV